MRLPAVVAVLLLLAATLLPWGGPAGGASAWSASWLWSAAVVLAMAAAFVPRHPAPLAPALALAGLALGVLRHATLGDQAAPVGVRVGLGLLVVQVVAVGLAVSGTRRPTTG